MLEDFMESFRLPAVSHESLIKIIQAYNSISKDNKVLQEDIEKLSYIKKDTIARNNAFLINVGIITKDKKITEFGEKLSRAYELNIQEEIINIWTNIIQTSEFLSGLITNLRISSKHFEFEEYRNKILYDSQDNNNTFTKAGASCIIEILQLCNFIIVNNGIISYNQRYKELNDMKNKIDKLEKLSEEISDTDNNKINNLREEIEDLNKDIQNYKLSDDFYKKSLRLEKESKYYSIRFISFICIDIFTIIILYFINIKFFNNDNIIFNIKIGLLSLGILGLFFWVTKYFNRRTHESIQLAEDYEHKALVLSLFSSYSKELKKLDRDDKQLLLDYVSKVSTTINKSPAINLSKRKPDTSPVEDLTDLLLNLSNFIKK